MKKLRVDHLDHMKMFFLRPVSIESVNYAYVLDSVNLTVRVRSDN